MELLDLTLNAVKDWKGQFQSKSGSVGEGRRGSWRRKGFYLCHSHRAGAPAMRGRGGEVVGEGTPPLKWILGFSRPGGPDGVCGSL